MGDETPNLPHVGYEYVRVADLVEADIASGRIPLGAMLPGERAMANQYGIATHTVRRVVRELRQRGWVATYPAKGTFVIAKPEQGGQPES